MAWKKDVNIEDDMQIQSKINAAGLINSTLERLWSECYTAMANGDYSRWNIKLDSIWAILGGDVKDNSDEEKKYNDISLKIYKTGALKSKLGMGFDKISNPNSALQYQYLLKKSLFLRRLQNNQGKGTAYATEEDDDI